MSKITKTQESMEYMKSQIIECVNDSDFDHKEERMQASNISKSILGQHSYQDVEINVFSHIRNIKTDNHIIICSDASVAPYDDPLLDGYASIGFIAYDSKTHEVVGCGQGELANRIGRKFSSFDAENIGILVSEYLMQDFHKRTIYCDNIQSQANIRKACHHTGKKVNIHWEKGHANSLGNIFADALATERMKRIKERERCLLGDNGISERTFSGRSQITSMDRLKERHQVENRKDKYKANGSRIDLTSSIIKFSDNPISALRTSIVHTPCIESAAKHVFMIAGFDKNNRIVSVETGSLANASMVKKIPGSAMTNIFMKHVFNYYSGMSEISVSRNLDKDYTRGLKYLERCSSDTSFQSVMALNMLSAGNGEINYTCENVIRGHDIENWDKGMRRGFVAVEGLRKKLLSLNDKEYKREKWKTQRIKRDTTQTMENVKSHNSPQLHM